MKERSNLRTLRGFHAIVETGSVTGAARQLGLSQPSVSRMLADLEAEIGFQLFHRDRGRLILTADGMLLHGEVGRSLGSIERVFSLVRDIAEFRVGELRLVGPPSLCESVVPDIAARFLKRLPGVRLSIDSRSVETARLMIANRMVDGGFVKLPLDRTDLVAEPLVQSEAVCVMASSHPLAQEPVLSPALVGRAPLILLGQGRTSRTQIEASFSDAGIKPNVRVETHTIGSACALAARGIGLTIVNGLLARSYLREGLIARPFAPKLMQDYAFVTTAEIEPSRLAQEFLADCRAYFAAVAA
ncbi:LysR substrate-binding domain-containing protein [Polymorphobacter sp.]|uniref:LysR substrate-binding domain-containing protein n=1 Tax=Polymorphobacter sp. TaxID=1909290 RepID=UPI003F72619E